ncbi:hypothetical protein [Salarchaeum japonicum]|uniref:hypothetical protein n=1 Tax=Salarchaeum japonicum TaxID=555573 RepID=UPI003C761F4B
MAERPQITTAKVQRRAYISACRDFLLTAAQSDRPSEASADDVTAAASTAASDLRQGFTAVSEVEAVACPCVRLGADSCRRL